MKNLAQLARDLYENKSLVYNETSGQDAMRRIFYDALGVEEGTRGRDLYYAFENNKIKVYAIISEIADGVVPSYLEGQYEPLVRYKTCNYGDEIHFTNENVDLFRIGLIAAGTQDLRRQTKLGSRYKISTDWYGGAIFTELEEFLAGQLDFAKFIDALSKSFEIFLNEKIHEVITKSYDALRASVKHTGSGSFDIEKLVELASRVQALSGGNTVTVYGTIQALGKLGVNIDKSDAMKDQVNNIGYLKTVRGLDLVAIPQGFKAGTEDFIISDKELLIVPSNEKIVDVLLEGEAWTRDVDPSERNDLQIGFKVLKKFGIQARQAAVYGIYKLS